MLKNGIDMHPPIYLSVLELDSRTFWIYYIDLLESEWGVPRNLLVSMLASFVVATVVTMFIYLFYVILDYVVSYHNG